MPIIQSILEWPTYRLIEQRCRWDSLLIWHYSWADGTIPVDSTMTFHLNSLALIAFYPDCYHLLCPYFPCQRQHLCQMLDRPDLVWILRICIQCIGIDCLMFEWSLIECIERFNNNCAYKMHMRTLSNGSTESGKIKYETKQQKMHAKLQT